MKMGFLDDDTFSYSVACLCGIALSLYALWVEIQKHRNPQYVAACDLGENMKCSRVLTSELVSLLSCLASCVRNRTDPISLQGILKSLTGGANS